MLSVFTLVIALSTNAQANCALVSTEGNLTCGGQVNGRVLGADPSDMTGYTCAYANQPGPDHTWDLICPATGQMTVTMSNLDCDMDLYAVSDCDPISGCATGSANVGLADEVIVFNCVAGYTAQIVVEGWAYAFWGGVDNCDAGDGNYTLTVDGGEPGCQAAEDCANGLDDDGDGLADCADSDCFANPVCQENCANGADDDLDGDIDCADSDCTGHPICNIQEDCTNGVDDNFNGLVDCDDSQCFPEAFCCDDDDDGFEDEACGGNDCDDSTFDASDVDSDGFSDGCDNCPEHFNFNQLDDDGDGSGNQCDACPEGSDAVDEDSDGVPDACDECPGASDTADEDADETPDGCDLCPGFDDREDADGDTVADGCDECAGGDDRIDIDGNGTPDLCDAADPGDIPSPDGDDDDSTELTEDEGKKGLGKLVPNFCGCQTTAPGGSTGWLLLIGLVAAMRRAR